MGFKTSYQRTYQTTKSFGTKIPFQNLTYIKIKGNGRDRGGNVIGIEFSFKSEWQHESQME